LADSTNRLLLAAACASQYNNGMILRRVLHLLPVISICAALLLGSSQALAVQSEEGKVFDNGHTVTGPFYTFYTSVGSPADSDAIFGLPITVVFDDPLPSGKKIQYFERVRMELDPATNQVSLAKIGEFAYDPEQPGLPAPSPANNDPRCRAFPNGMQVCYAFRDFYEKYGEKYFGLPVTNAVFTLERRLVPYFENVRMEWNGNLNRIVVTALGQVDFDKRIGNQKLRWPAGTLPGAIPLPQTIPNLHAFAGKPLVTSGDRQQVYVLLKDQFNKPIKGALVTVTFYIPENNKEATPVPSIMTDEDGIAVAEYEFANLVPNQVIRVEVSASVGGKEDKAVTWFRVWW
jgi:hypothetical protein